MKIILFIFTFFLVFSFVIFVSCTKPDSCTAGEGGMVTVVTYPQHHTRPILCHKNHPDTVFFKFNAQELPGTHASNYDLVVAGNVDDNFIRTPNLKCGNYFIYMTGFDTTLNVRVTGGIPYSFSQTTGEIDVNVPVTE